MGAEENLYWARHLAMCTPTMGQVAEWLRGLGTPASRPILSVKGPTPADRELVYVWCCPQRDREPSWVSDGVREHFISELSQLGSDWGVLWSLLDVEEFFVDEPLRSLVDQGLLFTEFYQTLWETRFLLQEGAPNVEHLVDSVVQWMTAHELSSEHRQSLARVRVSREVKSASEQLDLLFFLIALAKQNAALTQPVVVVYDGLDQAMGQSPYRRKQLLSDLLHIIETAERWNRLGSPVGIMVGLNEKATMQRLQGYNPKLRIKLDPSV